MSAPQALGACSLVGPHRVRYRNRKRARQGLDRGRRLCRARGIPEALWPAETFRCPPRDRGGCNGWHLRVDAVARREHWAASNRVFATLPRRVAELDALAG